MNYQRSGRGFTLIEILVAAGISSIIFTVGYYAISTTITTTRTTTRRIRDTENARLFFTMLERDLATATPGPGNMVKDREMLSSSPPPMHDPATNPAMLVVTETAPASDMVQFYCRPDLPGVRDENVFVRYYVNHNGNSFPYTLCRSAVVYDPNVVPPPGTNGLPENLNPLTLTTAPNNDSALFDNVYRLTVVFQKWDPVRKQFVKEPGYRPTQCDSLLVTIVFTNTYGNSQSTYRSFSTVISIPASFKQ